MYLFLGNERIFNPLDVDDHQMKTSQETTQQSRFIQFHIFQYWTIKIETDSQSQKIIKREVPEEVLKIISFTIVLAHLICYSQAILRILKNKTTLIVSSS